MNFQTFKLAVAKQFDRMQKQALFRADVEKDALWATYLASFPEGSNPHFRERTEHDCSCCRQFIRAVGDAVAIVDGELVSVWDVTMPNEPEYQAVANSLSAFVKSAKIADEFLHYERTAGTDKNFEQLVDRVQTWEHFFVNIQAKYVTAGASIASTLSASRSTHDVMLRSLSELTLDAADTVLELIAQRSLYRGEEHTFAVDAFRKLKIKFNALKTDAERDLFVWANAPTTPASVSKIRNTAIGTLLVDLSAGKDLEVAVKGFESVVAPINYKRPTALVTKGMIEKAKTKIAELGLTSALERRFATIHDITINNLLFANRDAKRVLNGDVFDELAAQVGGGKTKSFDKVEEVPIERFLADILPRVESLEVFVENQHANNLVSLIAPVDPTAGGLFKWANNFSWSYNGEVADSIKERVKKAGGNVSGDLCCRLAWYNHDDLDFHMEEPNGGHIYFGNKRSHAGQLDVDMNAGYGTTREPVENIFYQSRRTMKEGIYTLSVNNFNKRETTNVGFEVEIDFLGTVHRFAYSQAVANRHTVQVARFKYTHAGGVEFIESLPSTQSTKTVWGIPTQTFHKVNVMMLSPNHWDELAVGNKHYFFMLDGCVNDDSARGFYNEFLKESLSEHRKVFEMVGSKMKPVSSSEQLSGLGFSSTQKAALVCRVKGSFTRTIKVIF